ncbi:MAG: DUF302 domain-containing protein [Candidatus Marinimicrobia bacterium]|nr:DUF302 domain-containing protein [Candidatus Neomarinimicrobiota bacterium]
MEPKMSYGYFRILKDDFNQIDQRIRETLVENGFGVVTEIDVRQTMKNKLDVEFKPYKILGACNPQFAHQALTLEPDIGLLLPCNVIIEDNQDGTVRVGAIDAEKMLDITGREDLIGFAKEVNILLKKSIDTI